MAPSIYCLGLIASEYENLNEAFTTVTEDISLFWRLSSFELKVCTLEIMELFYPDKLLSEYTSYTALQFLGIVFFSSFSGSIIPFLMSAVSILHV